MTSPEPTPSLSLALELVEELGRVLAHGVHEDIDAAAVGHADHDLLDPEPPGTLDQIVEQRDGALAALEREALLPHVLSVQILFERGGRDQTFQDPVPLRRR